MKFNFLQKQTSRREMLRGSATLAGSVFLAHLFPARLLRASAAGYRQPAPSPADLLASMRAKFNAVPMEMQKLADNVTLFDGPGGAVTVLNGPDSIVTLLASFCVCMGTALNLARILASRSVGEAACCAEPAEARSNVAGKRCTKKGAAGQRGGIPQHFAA